MKVHVLFVRAQQIDNMYIHIAHALGVAHVTTISYMEYGRMEMNVTIQ